jgi:hypothetical protein
MLMYTSFVHDSVCHPSCGTCVGRPTTCLTCQTNRDLLETSCPCNKGYFAQVDQCLGTMLLRMQNVIFDVSLVKKQMLNALAVNLPWWENCKLMSAVASRDTLNNPTKNYALVTIYYIYFRMWRKLFRLYGKIYLLFSLYRYQDFG